MNARALIIGKHAVNLNKFRGNRFCRLDGITSNIGKDCFVLEGRIQIDNSVIKSGDTLKILTDTNETIDLRYYIDTIVLTGLTHKRIYEHKINLEFDNIDISLFEMNGTYRGNKINNDLTLLLVKRQSDG